MGGPIGVKGQAGRESGTLHSASKMSSLCICWEKRCCLELYLWGVELLTNID